MADDLKDVNKALQEANLAAEKSRQETNKNLQIVAENQKHDNAPRERILDALPEIIDQEKIAKREKLQRNALQKQDEEAEEQASEKARKVWVEGGTLDNAGELVIPEATAAQLLQWNADMIDAFIEATAENKKIDMIREELHKWTENRNYDRNNRMINLNMIPTYIEEEVLSQFNKTTETDGSKILSYFIEKRLRNLMENIQEFV